MFDYAVNSDDEDADSVSSDDPDPNIEDDASSLVEDGFVVGENESDSEELYLDSDEEGDGQDNGRENRKKAKLVQEYLANRIREALAANALQTYIELNCAQSNP